jgi:hypothetical protein
MFAFKRLSSFEIFFGTFVSLGRWIDDATHRMTGALPVKQQPR